MFRWLIEARNSASRGGGTRRDREETTRISGQEVPTHGKHGDFAERTNR